MRGSCNYKNKNKNHKRSTGGEGVRVSNKPTRHMTFTVKRSEKNEKRRNGKRQGKMLRNTQKKQKNTHSSGDATVHTLCTHTCTHTHKHWEITEQTGKKRM